MTLWDYIITWNDVKCYNSKELSSGNSKACISAFKIQ